MSGRSSWGALPPGAFKRKNPFTLCAFIRAGVMARGRRRNGCATFLTDCIVTGKEIESIRRVEGTTEFRNQQQGSAKPFWRTTGRDTLEEGLVSVRLKVWRAIEPSPLAIRSRIPAPASRPD